MGTAEQIADRVREFERAGAELLLLQFSPQLEEMERFAETVIPLVNGPPRRRRRTIHALEARSSERY